MTAPISSTEIESLPEFRAGSHVVLEERWHGRLWWAQPHVVVESSADLLVTWMPEGTTYACATNRGLPQAEGLDREHRKLLALQTCEVVVREFDEPLPMLHFTRAGSWARVNLAWTDEGLLGWYVNFQLPATPGTYGVVSKDLVLDLYIERDGRWFWKDEESFAEAVERGILDGALRDEFQKAADEVLAQHARSEGPFDPRWIEFRPDDSWDRPELPAAYRADGSGWEWTRAE